MNSILAGEPMVPDAFREPLISLEDREGDLGDDSRWSVRGLVGFGTSNTLFQALGNDFDRVPGTAVYSLELGYLLKEDWLGLPIDVTLAGAEMLHLSDNDPDRAFQTNFYVKLEWTRFWWDDFLRTRFGVGEGLSYVNEVTYSEIVRRGGRESKNFLNYLDFSLSLNVADLGELTRMDDLFRVDLDFLEDTWLVINVSHRSGIYGVFGGYRDFVSGDGERRPVQGGDNIVMMGLSHRF